MPDQTSPAGSAVNPAEGELSAEDVMVPRADIVAIEADTSLDDLVKAMSAEAHSRLPVCDGNPEVVIGIIQAKDLLDVFMRDEKTDLRKLVTAAPVVPDTMDALDVVVAPCGGALTSVENSNMSPGAISRASGVTVHS